MQNHDFYTVAYYTKQDQGSCRNHISFQLMLLLCLPLFDAYGVISLCKTCSLSLQ